MTETLSQVDECTLSAGSTFSQHMNTGAGYGSRSGAAKCSARRGATIVVGGSPIGVIASLNTNITPRDESRVRPHSSHYVYTDTYTSHQVGGCKRCSRPPNAARAVVVSCSAERLVSVVLESKGDGWLNGRALTYAVASGGRRGLILS